MPLFSQELMYVHAPWPKLCSILSKGEFQGTVEKHSEFCDLRQCFLQVSREQVSQMCHHLQVETKPPKNLFCNMLVDCEESSHSYFIMVGLVSPNSSFKPDLTVYTTFCAFESEQRLGVVRRNSRGLYHHGLWTSGLSFLEFIIKQCCISQYYNTYEGLLLLFFLSFKVPG